MAKNLKVNRGRIAAKNTQDKGKIMLIIPGDMKTKKKVYEYGKLQREKKKLNGSIKSYKDYTHMLPVDLMLKINRELITLKKSKEKVLSEYENDKYFKYIKIHIERVTKGA